MNHLPPPAIAAQQHSRRLVRLIRAEIERCGGWLGFDQYMALALYAPGLGYYSGGLQKFGAGGDFVTAPEISPLFGRCLARSIAQALEATAGDVLELGAGSGKLALDVLTELAALDRLPQRYLIMEVSQDLRARQRVFLESRLAPHLMRKVVWLETLPDRFRGTVLANEVLDALPVHLLVSTQQGGYERGVALGAEGLVWVDRPLAEGPLQTAAGNLDLPPGYVTEINLAAQGLIASLADSLQQGLLLLVDYGFPRREYYHPQRASGTLMCHYRQMAHADPLWFPGLQDITAHVDFTAIAEIAVAQGLRLMGYASQAQFLINCGLPEMLQGAAAPGSADYLALAAQAQKLLSPAEMGELFKVIAFGRNININPSGFAAGDQRFRL